MLQQQTMDKLHNMRLTGMAEAFQEQLSNSSAADLSFEERFTALVERQWIWKENRALATRLSSAKLKQAACIENLDYRQSRGLKREQINQLASCDWVEHHQNVIITGPTGVGKTYLACALAQRACRSGFKALYYYAPKLFRALSNAHADGSLPNLLKKIARVDLLVVDDWNTGKYDPLQFQYFLEVLDDRLKEGSTMMTSQFPVDAWYEAMPDPTVADAILDRLIHKAHRIDLKGASMRKEIG
jgi:DNA replication protein DnaC